MPWVTIKTGFVQADGQEAVLKEYLCDVPDCPNVAEQVVGVVRHIGMVCAVCREHSKTAQNRAS